MSNNPARGRAMHKTPLDVGSAPSGALSIPYTARYHATSSTVTAGSVAATATFTLSYQ